MVVIDPTLEAAQHESRHVAAALLLNVDVHDAHITHKGGGVTNFSTVTDLDSIVKIVSAGYWDGQHWPPSFPIDRGYGGDEAKLAQLCKDHSITQSRWDSLMDSTARLVDQPRFQHLSDVIAGLLLERGHLDGLTLKQLHKAVAKHTLEDDEDVTGQRDSDGLLSDDAISAVLEQERAKRAQASNGSVHAIEDNDSDQPIIVREINMLNAAVRAAYDSDAA